MLGSSATDPSVQLIMLTNACTAGGNAPAIAAAVGGLWLPKPVRPLGAGQGRHVSRRGCPAAAIGTGRGWGCGCYSASLLSVFSWARIIRSVDARTRAFLVRAFASSWLAPTRASH
ncbi:MAG: hypothetical protein RL701_5286 [Pseudomonadota bacterium]